MGERIAAQNAVIDFMREHACRSRPVYNPSLPSLFHPVFKFNAEDSQIEIPQEDISTPAAEALNVHRKEVSALHTGAGFLIMRYSNMQVDISSCFRVHKRLYVSSRYSTCEIATMGANARVQRYMWSPVINFPKNFLLSLTDEAECEKLGVILLRLLPQRPIYSDLAKDLDTDPRSSRTRPIKSDFAFFLSSPSLYDDYPYFLPSPRVFSEGEPVAAISYSTGFGELILDDLFDARIAEMPVRPSHVELRNLFRGYCVKSVSPGSLLSPVLPVDKQYILAHDASTSNSYSGAVIISLVNPESREFIGIHSGGWNVGELCNNKRDFAINGAPPTFPEVQLEDGRKTALLPNYNVAVSVHHPHFVAEYMRLVVPYFEGDIPAPVAQYLALHKNLLDTMLRAPL